MQLQRAWRDTCHDTAECTLLRVQTYLLALMVNMQPGMNHRSAIQNTCKLALDMVQIADDLQGDRQSSSAHFWCARCSPACPVAHLTILPFHHRLCRPRSLHSRSYTYMVH